MCEHLHCSFEYPICEYSREKDYYTIYKKQAPIRERFLIEVPIQKFIQKTHTQNNIIRLIP